MRFHWWMVALAVGFFILGGWWLFGGEEDDALPAETLTVSEAMTGETAGFARATEPREFQFPEDHGPHPDYRTEWWYVTGNLTAETGERFGYQFTIFRTSLSPPNGEDDREAGWRTNQFYMGHFAVSDIEREVHYHGERFSRGGAGLAGAQIEPFEVWLEDWRADGPAGEEPFPMRITAGDENAHFDLTLRPEKPKVFQADGGLSQKGPGEGNASYYFSYTRLATEGELVVDGQRYEVSGLSWKDREWSTSALAEDQEGWDWFALQLDDGRDVMYYQLRQDDGSASPFSKGIVVEEDGSSTVIEEEDVSVEVREEWQSPLGGSYPVKWHFSVPRAEIDLEIEAFFPEQEMDVSVRYWEGAVSIAGTSDGQSVEGRGFVEMTGYGDAAAVGQR